MAVLGALFYIFLWILVANGANQLEVPLLLPLILVILIVAGVGLDRYLGIPHRKQHFADPEDEEDQ
jgi:hypothetical protein